MKQWVSALLFLLLQTGCSAIVKVDLIVHHADIYTVNDRFDKATTLIVDKGKIVAVGGDTLMQRYSSSTMIDAKGNSVFPGFIDAHCHYTGYAMDAYKLKLFGTTSFEEVIQKVIEFSTSNQRVWIEGTGWDQNDWKQKQFPVKDTLDTLFPSTPVFLLRVDGHAVLLNQKALDICGIHAGTRVDGGEVEIKNGELTGILIDNAINLVRSHLPALTPKEATQYIVSAQDEFLKVGLTSIVECGVKKEVIDWMDKAYQKDQLQLRTTFMLNADDDCMDAHLNKKPLKTDRLHIAGFKVYADGSLGSRGAFLLREYSDRPHHVGSMLISVDSLEEIAIKIEKSPYQLCSHAIGDAANRKVIEKYAGVLKGPNNRRWRIEHAQVVDTNDMHFFGDFSIIPSVQPTHATSDMYWAGDRLGEERLKEAYAYKELLKQNRWMPLGTDFPVEQLNPLYTFYAAVFRKDRENYPSSGFQFENALTREEALRGMTIWAAKSVLKKMKKAVWSRVSWPIL